MNSLKPGWKMVKFGDIAQNVADRVDPTDAKTDVYVGLEHLDPSTIHLRQWGHPSEVTGQKLAFKKGDVIFGRRRAYQRKLAVAEFDGICSAHAMVVRAKPKMIQPEFLPFFLHSDMFMDRAIEISVGSPRRLTGKRC
jgi:type I restriction enzyme, S subunit